MDERKRKMLIIKGLPIPGLVFYAFLFQVNTKV
jgi:hypothetical protein